MNTPKPCSRCGFNYWDTMTQDDPNSSFECLKHLSVGVIGCTGFKDWKETTIEEK